MDQYKSKILISFWTLLSVCVGSSQNWGRGSKLSNNLCHAIRTISGEERGLFSFQGETEKNTINNRNERFINHNFNSHSHASRFDDIPSTKFPYEEIRRFDDKFQFVIALKRDGNWAILRHYHEQNKRISMRSHKILQILSAKMFKWICCIHSTWK